LALVVSIVAGLVIYFTAGELEGRPEQIFEGLATFIAAGILTWMIFWMRRQAVNIRNELQAQIELALGRGSSTSLMLLAFVAVVREGIETILFLFAATRVAESPRLFAMGALLGLASAVAIGYGIYKGTSRLNLRVFFNVTSPLLIVFAAGLLAHGIMEFHEAGIIPTIIDHVWDTSVVIPEQSVTGVFLTTLFGYSSRPSLVQVVVYFGYLLSILLLYFRPTKRH
jgi:high-affinity iron transporter